MEIYIIFYVHAQIAFFWGKLVLEAWLKMLSANQIAGFLNQLYLQEK